MDLEKAGILLESGTNEIEVIMFQIGQSLFGINVLKVREIVNAFAVTTVPSSNPNVEGMIRIREEVMPVVNLARVLTLPPSENPQMDKFIVCEFNKQKVVFRVHNVSRIYRIKWDQIEKPSEISSGDNEYAIGLIKLEDEMPILLDFEKIVIEISPKANLDLDSLDVLGDREVSDKQIILVEDSAVLRMAMKRALVKVGYHNLTFFEDGQAAWDYLEGIANDTGGQVSDHVDLVISDIEMPQMDGHHLTMKIRGNTRLSHLPVIIYSSLISPELRHKGESVGANAQVSKKDVLLLIEKIDELI